MSDVTLMSEDTDENDEGDEDAEEEKGDECDENGNKDKYVFPMSSYCISGCNPNPKTINLFPWRYLVFKTFRGLS